MFAKLFRDEPEVLALLAIVIIAFVSPAVPRFSRGPEYRLDLDAGLHSLERPLPRIQFIRFR